MKKVKAGENGLKHELISLYQQRAELEKRVIPPTITTDDCTQRELARILSHNNCTVSSISSEAGEAIQTLLGKWNAAKKTDDTLFLKGYSLEDRSFARSTSELFNLHELAINVFWLVQPRYIVDMFSSDSLLNGGFLARCLICDTKAEPQELTGYERPINSETRLLYTEDMLKIFREFRMREPQVDLLGKKKVKFSEIQADPEVHILMRDYYNKWVRLRKGNLRDISHFCARWCENAWRIAVCLHAAKYVDRAANKNLEMETAEKAITIMDWFVKQILELMHMGREQQEDSELTRLLNYVKSKGDECCSITIRKLKRVRFTEQAIEKFAAAHPDKLEIRSVFTSSRISAAVLAFAISKRLTPNLASESKPSQLSRLTNDLIAIICLNLPIPLDKWKHRLVPNRSCEPEARLEFQIRPTQTIPDLHR
jgi:hypothetical protein